MALSIAGPRQTLGWEDRLLNRFNIRQHSSRVIFHIPIDRVNWTTGAFLIGTFVLALTAAHPIYGTLASIRFISRSSQC